MLEARARMVGARLRGNVFVMLVTLALGWIVLNASRTVLYPMLPILGEEFHLTGAQTGAIASVYFLLYVSMQIPSGIVGDRLGLKRVALTMYVLAGLSVLAFGLLASNYTLLILFAALHGLGSSAFFGGSYGITMQSVPPGKRGLGTAIVSSGMSLGQGLGILVSGIIFVALGSWRAPFIILAVAAFFSVLFLSVMVRDVGKPQKRELGSLLYVFKDKNLVVLLIAGFFAFYGGWVVMTWGPAFLSTERGMSIQRAGFYISLITFASVPGRFVSGPLSDFLGRKTLSISLLSVGVFAILGMVLVKSHLGILLATIAFGLFGSAAMGPVLIAWVGDSMSATGRVGMGTAMAIANTSFVGGSIIGPVLSGFIKDVTGSLVGAFYVAAASLVLGILLLLIPAETVKRQKRLPRTGA